MPTVSYMYGNIGCVLNEPKKLTAQENMQKNFLEHQIDWIMSSKTAAQEQIVYWQNRQTEYNMLLAGRKLELYNLLG